MIRVKKGPRGRLPVIGAGAALIVALTLPTPAAQVSEAVDLDAIYKIKAEGFQRSQVMQTLSWLTDVHGPRLTNSPSIKAAGEWAVQTLAAWGLTHARREPWGEFGRGWSNEKAYVQVTAPSAYTVIAYPKAWTPGTNGPVTAEAVMPKIDSEADFEKLKGTLKGKVVLALPLREVQALWNAPATRLTDEDLAALEAQPDPSRFGPGLLPDPSDASPQRYARYSPEMLRQYRAARDLNEKKIRFFKEEGVLAVLEAGDGDGGTVFVQGGGSRNPKDPETLPHVVLAVEHYGRIARTLAKNIPVTLELDVRNTFHDQDLQGYNVIAEIPGMDKADEVVMLGGHFDAWHGGTGATDNAAGSAVMMEAVRIMKATGLKTRRTIRIALWDGEEQGLFGSRGYVKATFADSETMVLKPAHAKLAGYFNMDNGTGAIRGVYLQGNEAVAPIFAAWMQPFNNLGMTTLAIQGTDGTDHLSFDAVGLPGFQFIQDTVEYRTRTHHSSMDVYERVQPNDMMKNAVIVASFVYHAANRDERLPRKPLPKPQPTRPIPSQD